LRLTCQIKLTFGIFYSNGSKSNAKSFNPKVPRGLAISEMMAFEMFYHLQGSKCFKHYYKYFVEVHLKEYFPGLPCYNRFVQLKPRLFIYLFVSSWLAGWEQGPGYITLIHQNGRMP